MCAVSQWSVSIVRCHHETWGWSVTQLTHTFGFTMGTNSQTQMELFPNYFSISRQLSTSIVPKLSSSIFQHWTIQLMDLFKNLAVENIMYFVLQAAWSLDPPVYWLEAPLFSVREPGCHILLSEFDSDCLSRGIYTIIGHIGGPRVSGLCHPTQSSDWSK